MTSRFFWGCAESLDVGKFVSLVGMIKWCYWLVNFILSGYEIQLECKKWYIVYLLHILCHGDTKDKKIKTNFICEKNVYLGKELYNVILWMILTGFFHIFWHFFEYFLIDTIKILNFKILNCKYSLNLHLNFKISIVITNYEFFNISN